MAIIGDITVLEGSSARYAIYLDGDLAQNIKLSFTLRVGGTATVGDDFLQLLGESLVPAPGVSITFTTNPGDGSIVVTVEYSTGTAIPADPLPGPGNPGFPTLGAQLLSFEIETIVDNVVETGDNIVIEILNSSDILVLQNFSTATSPTVIVDGPLQIKLIGSSSVAEGSIATYSVILDDGVALGIGQSFSFSLDTAGLTATEGIDFAQLIASNITVATGFSLVGTPVIDPEDGRIKLTVVNSSGSVINEFQNVVNISIATTQDLLVEGTEIFSLTLSNPTGTTLGTSVVTTSINDDDGTPKIRLIGSSSVAEGSIATYSVILDDGVALGIGQSFSFSLDTAGLTATEGIDFAQLIASNITVATGFSLVGTPVIDPEDGRIKLTVVNSSGSVINEFQNVVNISIATTQDLLVEGTEIFSLTLSNPTGTTLGTSVVTTSINDDDGTPKIRLIGEAIVAEGAAAAYAVELEGTALAVGQIFSISLDTAGFTALEGKDFSALIASNITAATGITLSDISTNPISKEVTLTATNTSGAALDAGRQILTFAVAVTADSIAEVNEAYTVSLTSGTATVTNGTVLTIINNVGGFITANTSDLEWSELNSGATIFLGIAGTEVAPITVNTGSAGDLVKLDDAIAFAILDTGSGNDSIDVIVSDIRDELTRPYVQFGHGAYKAIILAGDGDDRINIQSFENTKYKRQTPQDPPFYNLPDYYDSYVDAGAGDDYVYGFLPYKTQFLGGDGEDTLFLYGRFSDWSVEGKGQSLSDDPVNLNYTTWNASTTLSNTAIENTVRGFEIIQFNDIKLDLVEALFLTPAQPLFDEATAATYSISLDRSGNGLSRSQSVAFTLQLINGSAQFATDLAPLAKNFLRGVDGIALQDVTVDAVTGRISVIASATENFKSGVAIATISIPVLSDSLFEASEEFGITLEGFFQTQVITTTIPQNDQPTISVSVAPVSAAEDGVTNLVYTFTLSNASAFATVVNYTLSGTAANACGG
ncbi:MAG: Calx-beta domain-containing protein [Candidatus Andersenbacteria bacterium]